MDMNGSSSCMYLNGSSSACFHTRYYFECELREDEENVHVEMYTVLDETIEYDVILVGHRSRLTLN